MATDPVCFMIVDEENNPFVSTYKGTDYYFCCNYCKKQFDADPKRYSRILADVNVDLTGC
ncbi:YHS domain-containing protein [Methanoregula sp. UBA64]|jgi:YHS domain-containing protein|uniref:YHS domain-containing protein n=1 Tax=Methanoregula sp. UBA64 TaxID=1915554 RepID=UPI0025D62088|nr:YHS domain-containing protein [Methanoregula sp. UBA64]